MKCTAEKAIEIARQYIGYHEGANNDVPWLEILFEDYPQMDDDAPWCDKFLDGIIVIACDYDYRKAQYVLCGDFDDYTVVSADYYKDSGRYGQEPRKGAQIFLRNASGICHTGIVTGYDDETVYTIEGNAADEVRFRSYALDDWSIDGYGYPRYDEEKTEEIWSDDMNCLIKPDGKDYMVWFDGHAIHPLDNEDEMQAVQEVYRKCNDGREMPVFEFGSEEAPWFHRFADAVTHTYKDTHM